MIFITVKIVLSLYFEVNLDQLHVFLLQLSNLFCLFHLPLYLVFQIRMYPGFFAVPDPGFKSPDPSINRLWDQNDDFKGFGGACSKRTVLRVLDRIVKYLYFTPVLRRFFHGSGFFRIGSGFLAESDPD